MQKQSFMKKQTPWKREPIEPIILGGKGGTTAAQLMTIIGYGDSSTLPMRSLDYKVKCEDYSDFAQCIRIIKGYNEFDADRILRNVESVLNLKHYINDNNPNNGKGLFDFYIGRANSPVFYIEYNEYFGKHIIVKSEPVKEPEEGHILYYEDYDGERFKKDMAGIKYPILADEFTIEEEEYGKGMKYFTARFWFD